MFIGRERDLKDLFAFSSLEQLNGLESMFGLQFENLVLNNL